MGMVNRRERSPIVLGSCLPQDATADLPEISYDAAILARHVRRPWFRAFLTKRHGITFSRAEEAATEAAASDAALARHAFICGATGSGKTRLLLHLIREQLKRGCSAVVLDQKFETIQAVLACAQEIGIPAEQVTVISPDHASRVPGWNPLLAEHASLSQAVSDVVALLQDQNAGVAGPRMWDLLTNALLVLGAHELSLQELPDLLRRSDYRETLLTTPVGAQSLPAYQEACSFFWDEYGTWSKSERAQAFSPVLNKVRELITSPFFLSLLCAHQNTLQLSRLWQRPGLVLVHVDRAALGEQGARLLAGLMASALFRVAMRASGPVPVALCLDELATVERYVGEALCQTLTLARGYNLRLLAACQHLSQLSEPLRNALLGNAGLRVFFRLGFADARLVATAFTTGGEDLTTRVHVDVDYADRKTGELRWARSNHAILDGYGRPLRIRPEVWDEWSERAGVLGDALGDLLALAAQSGIRRCYVRPPDGSDPVEVRQYVAGLVGTDYRITGPAPLNLVVSFPQPHVSGIARASESDRTHMMVRRLQSLPIRHAVCAGVDLPLATVRVVNVPSVTRSARLDQYLCAALAANGQAPEAAWRQRPAAPPPNLQRPPDAERTPPAPSVRHPPTPDTQKPARRRTVTPRRDAAPIGANLTYIQHEGDDDGSIA